MEDTKNTQKITEPVDEITKQALQIRDLLSKINGTGYTAIVWRTAPKWCEGYLEDLDLDDEGINIGYLREKWGGEKLHIKIQDEKGVIRGGATLNLKSWKPKVNGREISQYDTFEMAGPERKMPGRPRKNEVTPQLVPYNATMQQQQQIPSMDPTKMFEQMMGFFMQMKKLESKHEQVSPTLGDSSSGLDQLMSAMKVYKELHKMFGDSVNQQPEQPVEQDGLAGIMQMIGPIAQMFSKQSQAPSPVPQAPYPVPRPVQNVIRNDVNPQSIPYPQAPPQSTPQAPPQNVDLSAQLASLGSSKLAELFEETLNKMKPQDQTQLFGEIGTRLGYYEDVEYEEEGTVEDDDFEDESDPHSLHSRYSDQGESLRSDERDDPPNRDGDRVGFPVPTDSQ